MTSCKEINSLKTCEICCFERSIFAIGTCNHRICYICCLRFRFVAKQNTCLVCRIKIDKYIFTDKIEYSYDDFRNKDVIYDGKLSIYIYDSNSYGNGNRFHNSTESIVSNKIHEALEIKCKYCPTEFDLFESLKDHVKKIHNQFYCDVCTNSLLLLPTEFNTYGLKELHSHKLFGDKTTNSSTNGHPKCEFCEDYHLDKDALAIHLRLKHQMCQLCLQITSKTIFFIGTTELIEHFSKKHHICQYEDCLKDPLANVYRSKKELELHILEKHQKYLDKNKKKQMQTIEIDLEKLNVRTQKKSEMNKTPEVQSTPNSVFDRNALNHMLNAQSTNNNSSSTSNIEEFPSLVSNDRPNISHSKVIQTKISNENNNNMNRIKNSTQQNLNHKANNSNEKTTSLAEVMKADSSVLNHQEDFPELPLNISNSNKLHKNNLSLNDSSKANRNKNNLKTTIPVVDYTYLPLTYKQPKNKANNKPISNVNGQQTTKPDFPSEHTKIQSSDILINFIRNELSTSQADSFKQLSANFKNGRLSSDDYCKNLVENMGQYKFDQIINHLINSLNDSSLQRQLKTSFNKYK